jgi:hypothetical protein
MITTVLMLATTAQAADFDGGVRVRSSATQQGETITTSSLLRTRLGVTWGEDDAVGGRLVFQDSRSLSDMVVSSAGSLMLHEGYLSASSEAGLTMQVGRREMSFGKQRLVTALPWHNSGKAFDGLFVVGDGESLPVGFTAWAVQPNFPASDGEEIAGSHFQGLYLDRNLNDTMSVEAWTMRNQVESTSVERVTAGGAYRLRTGPIAADVEGSYQLGNVGDDSIAAYAAALNAQWTGSEVSLKPRVGGEVNIASGDTEAGDGVSNTYDPLHPLGHAYWGHQDLVGGRNAMDLRAWVGATIFDTPVTVDLHLLSAVSLEDDFYQANGAGRGADLTGASDSNIGTEIDLYAKPKLDSLNTLVGVSAFLPGGVAKAAGMSDPILWGYLQFTSSFN